MSGGPSGANEPRVSSDCAEPSATDGPRVVGEPSVTGGPSVTTGVASAACESGEVADETGVAGGASEAGKANLTSGRSARRKTQPKGLIEEMWCILTRSKRGHAAFKKDGKV